MSGSDKSPIHLSTNDLKASCRIVGKSSTWRDRPATSKINHNSAIALNTVDQNGCCPGDRDRRVMFGRTSIGQPHKPGRRISSGRPLIATQRCHWIDARGAPRWDCADNSCYQAKQQAARPQHYRVARARVREPAAADASLRYSLRNRTRSLGGHGRSRSAAAR